MFLSILLRSLWYDRWINAAVVFGVVCAAAVLTGALLVGDSMRGSLKSLTLDRLGNIDTILFASQFIEYAPHPSPLPEGEGTIKSGGHTPPGATASEGVILLPAAVEFNGKISGVQLLGRGNSTIANQALADKIGLRSGDTISLRLMPPQSIPPESSLGRKDQLLRTRIQVEQIVPNKGIGRFSLKTDQQAEPLLIVPLPVLQRLLKVGDKVNAVFYMNDSPQPLLAAQREAVKQSFKPTLEDLGITAEWHNDQWYIKSARMLFNDEQAEAIENALTGGLTPPRSLGLLYLATSIRAVKNNRETPYSTVYAVGDGRQQTADGSEEEDGVAAEILPSISLNRWTADDLAVEVGDDIELTWFDPDNVAVTRTKTFKLVKIFPLEVINDPYVVPTVQGFTDEVSIADWDPPFPFDAKKIRKKDEDYWDKYRAAPKAFVSLKTGQEFFGSRFGKVTTIVLSKSPSEPQSLDCADFRNLTIAALFGLNFVPVKEQGLAASAGTTPFSVLFLSFSFFIIASALMLVMLLFRLSVEMKAKRIGILLAVGWTRRQVAQSLLAEGFLLSLIGSFFGALLGIGYAAVMIYGLTTWWGDAVTTPFLTLFINPMSLVIGFASGVVLSVLTILWSARGVTKVPLQSLLHGEVNRAAIVRLRNTPQSKDCGSDTTKAQRSFLRWLFHLTCIMVITFPFFCALVESNTFAFANFFVGSPFIILYGLLLFPTRKNNHLVERVVIKSSLTFALSNATRNSSRSLLCVALVASTTFLVLSISAFRMQPESKYDISYMGETRFPVYTNISTPEGREKLSIQPDDEQYLTSQDNMSILPFRMRDGDSASCLNLYQTGNPRVLGIPKSTFEKYTCRSFSSYPIEKTDSLALRRPITTDSDGVRRVPVILDQNTAMYSLHLYGGIGDVYELDIGQGKKVRCEIVGLLSNSILQGEIIMGEENFLQLFPEVGGYRYFLLEMRPPLNTEVNDRTLKIMYDLLGDYGFQGEPTADRLRKLFAIQNTYLSTFQSLGGIGLLLGMFGLAVIQSRNVLERRKELALLLAIGFTKSRVILLLLYESFTLLAWGLGLAVLASAFALLPFLLGGVQQVSAVSVLQQFVILVGGLLLVGVVSNVAAALAVLKIPVARELAEER